MNKGRIDAKDDLRPVRLLLVSFHAEKPRTECSLFHPVCDFLEPVTGFLGSGNVQRQGLANLLRETDRLRKGLSVGNGRWPQKKDNPIGDDVDGAMKVCGRGQLRLDGLDGLGSQCGELESMTDGSIGGHDAGSNRIGDDGEAVASGQRLA